MAALIFAGCGDNGEATSPPAPAPSPDNNSSREGVEPGAGGPGTDQARDLFACLQMRVADAKYEAALGVEGLPANLRQMFTSAEQAAFITLPPAGLNNQADPALKAAPITLYTFGNPEAAFSFREAFAERGLRAFRMKRDQPGPDPVIGEGKPLTTLPNVQVSARVVILGYDTLTDRQLALLAECGLTGLTAKG